MKWSYVDDDHIVVGDSLVELPTVGINSSVHISTTVAIDGVPIEVSQAVRILLAHRSLFQQEIADLKERIAELERARAA